MCIILSRIVLQLVLEASVLQPPNSFQYPTPQHNSFEFFRWILLTFISIFLNNILMFLHFFGGGEVRHYLDSLPTEGMTLILPNALGFITYKHISAQRCWLQFWFDQYSVFTWSLHCQHSWHWDSGIYDSLSLQTFVSSGVDNCPVSFLLIFLLEFNEHHKFILTLSIYLNILCYFFFHALSCEIISSWSLLPVLSWIVSLWASCLYLGLFPHFLPRNSLDPFSLVEWPGVINPMLSSLFG